MDLLPVIGVVRGTGGGKSLMFNGHTDTVTLVGYDGDPLSGDILDDTVQGRGTMDMKAGIAASTATLNRVQQMQLKGDVILSAVADEENLSIGMEEILAGGWRADGAIVCEPSGHDVVLSHKGFVWLEVDVLGVAAHGSRPSEGIDSILKAGYFLVELDKYAVELMSRPPHAELGTGIVHASTIRGGEEPSTYPAKCTITTERRTLPGETSKVVEHEITGILKKIGDRIPDFRFEVRVILNALHSGLLRPTLLS